MFERTRPSLTYTYEYTHTHTTPSRVHIRMTTHTATNTYACMHAHTCTSCSQLADSPPHRFAVVEDTVVVHTTLSHIEVRLEETTPQKTKCVCVCVCVCACAVCGVHVCVWCVCMRVCMHIHMFTVNYQILAHYISWQLNHSMVHTKCWLYTEG